MQSYSKRSGQLIKVEETNDATDAKKTDVSGRLMNAGILKQELPMTYTEHREKQLLLSSVISINMYSNPNNCASTAVSTQFPQIKYR